MAKMVLSDLGFTPEVFRDNVLQMARESSPLFNAGIIVDAPIVLPERGNTVAMPYFTDLSGDPEGLSDSGALTENKVSQDAAIALVQRMGKAFTYNDLVGWTAGGNPLQNLEVRFARYWKNALEKRAIKSLIGVSEIASVANTLDKSAVASGTSTMTAENIFDALKLRGEAMYDNEFIVLSPAMATILSKGDLIATAKDSDGKQVRSFGGRELVVSQHAGNYVFICGRGLIGYADGTPAEVILEEERSILAGDNRFTSRMVSCLHPLGYSYAGTFAQKVADSALIDGTNWEVAVSEIASIPLVTLITNGE